MKLFFLIFMILVLLLILFLSSSLKINIKSLRVDTTNSQILTNYNISVRLYILKKIRIIGINVNEKKIKNIESSKIINFLVNNLNINNKSSKSTINKIKNKISANIENKIIYNLKSGKYNKKQIIYLIKTIIKNIKIELKKLNMRLLVGTEDILVTTYLIPVISLIISLIIKFTTNNINKNYSYSIEPVYNRNLIKLDLNCIIQLKLVHIINIIYILSTKKRRSDKYERTSNRRPYGYSHE